MSICASSSLVQVLHSSFINTKLEQPSVRFLLSCSLVLNSFELLFHLFVFKRFQVCQLVGFTKVFCVFKTDNNSLFWHICLLAYTQNLSDLHPCDDGPNWEERKHRGDEIKVALCGLFFIKNCKLVNTTVICFWYVFASSCFSVIHIECCVSVVSCYHMCSLLF